MKNKLEELSTINVAIRNACETSFGFLDQGFLCKSIGTINPKPALCVDLSTPTHEVIGILKSNRAGCLAVLKEEKLVGIFSERDVILRVDLGDSRSLDRPISEYMTADPVTAEPQTSIAYALNLMSLGGFRHLPLLVDNDCLIGIISVKDVIDYLVEQLNRDLLQFKI